jgi:hypothetical protein
MCLACEEMDLHFAYLEQQEQAKKRAAVQSAPPDQVSAQSSGAELPAVPAAAQFSCEDPTRR